MTDRLAAATAAGLGPAYVLAAPALGALSGFLTVALMPKFGWDTFKVEGVSMTVNYGLNKVRFPAPVPVGSRVRGHCRLVDVSDVPNGVQATIGGTVEIEGWPKPACVAEVILRYAY